MDSNIAAIEETLCKEISTILDVDISLVKKDSFLPQLGLDSMGFVELLVFIEKKFQIKLIESGLNKSDFETIAALSRKIAQAG